ncbi:MULTISPECIES: sensor histidine kinase [Enterobacterales]|uniref:sensor histidine kinase n=1 Tax=Enterobacterales TaxID=91347 RepID=UPI002EDB9704
MQQKFPQIQALEKTHNRPLDAPRVEQFSAAHYWLYNPYKQIRVRIDLEPLLRSSSHFASVQLTQDDAPPPSVYRWQWTRQFPQHFQPFTLNAGANPEWGNFSLLPHLLIATGWAIFVGMGGLLLWGRRQQRSDRQRADYYQHARLNTLGEMSAGVVHEINQPLTATQMWLQGGMRQLTNGHHEEALHAMRSALMQTQRISELLTRFRAHLTQEEVAMTKVSLTQSWQRVSNLLEHEPGSKHIRITHELADVQIQADKLWLEQVLHNLLSNAIQVQQGNPHGWVHIRSESVDDRVKVIITDGGPGFSPQTLKHAMMPLFSERQGGLGLGLTLTESLMTKMNGTLQLANSPQGGAEISLWFIKEN